MSALAVLMQPVGPVAEKFTWDKRLITGIMGPVGSAKTTQCIRKCVLTAIWQNKGPDGVRRARVGVIRDTYPQLKRTVLQSWFSWFPKEWGDWNGESPFTHKISLTVPGIGPIELEMIFAAIGENKVEDVMRGWEITALWINEADLVARDVQRLGLGRIGRYPNKALGGCAWRGIFVDFNAPDSDNWVYSLFVDGDLGIDPETLAELREDFGDLLGVGFHRQPGGRSRNPRPENVDNLPKGYYAQQMIGQSADFIRRMIDNEFGAVRNGLPVYPEFKDVLHVAAEPLEPVRGIPIDIGVDGGLTPAATIGQKLPNGQRRILDELVVWIDKERQELDQVGPTAFGEMLRAHCDLSYPDNPVRHVWCDPATSAGEGAAGQDRSWLQLFSMAFGQVARRSPVKGNSIHLRLDSVRRSLRGLAGDGEPEYLLSPKCKANRKAKNSGYIYRRTTLAGGDDRYKNEPVKNQHSHGQDSEQYLSCGWDGPTSEGFDDSSRRRPSRPGRRGRVIVDNDYNVLGD